MDGFNWSRGLRQVIELARSAADAEHADAIGTQHLVRAVLQVAEGSDEPGIATLHLDLAAIHRVLPRTTVTAPAQATAVKLEFTRKATRALEIAMMEARDDSRSDTGLLHLLLGIVAVDGVAAQAMRDAGVTEEVVRRGL